MIADDGITVIVAGAFTSCCSVFDADTTTVSLTVGCVVVCSGLGGVVWAVCPCAVSDELAATRTSAVARTNERIAFIRGPPPSVTRHDSGVTSGPIIS